VDERASEKGRKGIGKGVYKVLTKVRTLYRGQINKGIITKRIKIVEQIPKIKTEHLFLRN
jgi:hypothetical protein